MIIIKSFRYALNQLLPLRIFLILLTYTIVIPINFQLACAVLAVGYISVNGVNACSRECSFSLPLMK